MKTVPVRQLIMVNKGKQHKYLIEPLLVQSYRWAHRGHSEGEKNKHIHFL